MAISDEDISRLDGRYKRLDACESTHKDLDTKVVNLTVAFTETKSQFKLVLGMLGAIGTIVAGILAKLLFG